MRVDAHQHFWRYEETDPELDWIEPHMSAIRRTFSPADLEPELEQHRLSGSVVVQAAQTEAENRYLLELADQHAFILGVVGWVDLMSDRVEEKLAPLAAHPKFKGVRRIVQAEPMELLVDPRFQRGVGVLGRYDLTYDLLITWQQLPAAVALAGHFPEQRFVLDHIAKPDIRNGAIEPWASGIAELSALPNVWCKVSGLVTEADLQSWTPKDLTPYLDIVFERFAKDRLMFGSDWPVCLLAGSYAHIYEVIERYSACLSEEARALLFGGSARAFYKL